MSLEVLILTIAFSIAMNSIIVHLDALPNYSCPPYCEVDHKHFNNNKEQNYVRNDWKFNSEQGDSLCRSWFGGDIRCMGLEEDSE